MVHLPNLINDLALILGAAAVVTLIFRKLRQPVVLGYIIAGLLVGPHFKIFPTVGEIESIRTWADIGVIFLLFSLGLEFSFKKLIKVGSVAGLTAIIEVSLTMALGYFVGQMLGWSSMDSIFLGGILAIASTTIIMRAFDELGAKTQKFTGIVMGVLIVEDLVAVVLMVVLSTLAISREFAGTEMFGSILKLVFFLVLWFVSGIFFLPSLLKKLRNLLTEEILLVVSLALCFLMVVFATVVGFSSALGAFIMGSILAETTKSEKIEHLIKPVKDLFGAIFFVSVGMLIEPGMLVEYAGPVLIASLVLLFGKPLFVMLGILLTGQPLKIAVQSGMSLSQIGEFSFIIATLGLTLKVTSDFLYPVAVAVSVITTFTTPYMIRFSPAVYKRIESWLPGRLRQNLNAYSMGAQRIQEVSDWKKLLRFSLINIVVFSVIIVTIILVSTNYLAPLFSEREWGNVITAVVSLVILAPFLWALAFRRTQQQAYANVWTKPLLRGPLITLLTLRIALAIFYTGFLLDRLFSPLIAVIAALCVCMVLLLLYKRIKAFYGRIEFRFLDNLHAKEARQETPASSLVPWDAHLATFELTAYSPYIGKTLLESGMREEYGINIAIIERGNRVINVPARDERLFPHDIISVIGTDEQLSAFREHMERSSGEPLLLADSPRVVLEHFTVSDTSSLLGKTIRHSGIRELTKGLVVGIERDDNRILNPESDTVFEPNDIVWVVGNKKRIQVLIKENKAR